LKFANEIGVARPPEEVFAAVTDLERVAPCLPGAGVEGRDGEDFIGRIDVRVGPISAAYRGRLRFVSLDGERRRAVLKARGDELSGRGSAEAQITISVSGAGGTSRIGVETDLQLRGRLAQFGRGAIDAIAARMLREFAANLEALLAGAPTVRESARPAPAALDVGRLIATARLRRLVGPAAWALVGFSYGYLLGRLHERTTARG
jgi:carbon monoxide dehydrogenase subunit G